MQVTATIGSINAGITRSTGNDVETESSPNAFGIGEANRADVELSPQARILQQTDVKQRGLREQLEQQRENSRQEETQEPERNNGFVRVSSSEGSTQRSNLPSEKAVEVYQAISKLL